MAGADRTSVARALEEQLHVWAPPVVAAAQLCSTPCRGTVRGATSGKAGLSGGREEGEGVSERGR